MTTANPGVTSEMRKNNLRRAILPYLYLVPAFAIMAVITFYPLIYQVIVSFTDFQTKDLLLGLSSPKLQWIGIQNYVQILTGGLPVQNFEFFRVLTYNFWWAITNVAVHLPAGVLIAVLLNVQGLWFKKIYRAVYILPVVVPPLVVATVWRNIFDEQYGAMNQFLTSMATFFGSADGPIRLRWLTEYTPPIPWLLPDLKIAGLQVLAPLPLAYYAMMIANFWLGWPFMTVVATGALQSIPKDLYEAASIDGASDQQQFWTITVPLLRPAMVPAAVYGFNTSFTLFAFVYFMSGGGPARSTEILVTFAYDLVRNLRLYGAAAAFAVIVFFVAITVFLITNRITKATESYTEA
jgi:arabinogalactan oligomer/maltooligosaccharide transport system permease protein